MACWLLKTEPSTYGFSTLQTDKKTLWTGVKNPVAQKYLKQMAPNDAVFIYHTGDEKQVVGQATVTSVGAPDNTAPKGSGFVSPEISVGPPLARPVTLAEIKQHPVLSQLPIVRQSRLSVCPVTTEQQKILLTLGR